MSTRHFLPRTMTRRALLGGALALGATAAAAGRADAADGAWVSGTSWLSDREFVATVSATTMRNPVDVRVLLPTSYATHPNRRYPVLYLLHGSQADHNAWADLAGVHDVAGAAEVILVMPDGGQGGWYVNHEHSSVGPVNWETFHTRDLVSIIDENLRTLPWWSARGIAGFSMGGYGAAIYAGRNPGLYRTVSCYSGATDSYDPSWRAEMASQPGLDGENPYSIYGVAPGYEDDADLRRNNPATYASALTSRRIRLFTGDVTGGYEDKLRASTKVFYDALYAAGAQDLDWRAVPGDHSWSTAANALRADLPGILSTLLRPQDW